MAMIRARLYEGLSDSVFARDCGDLLYAVSEPAAYLHARSLKLPGARYLEILGEVLERIVARGDFAASRNKPAYLRQCCQVHMRMFGERYLDEAKGIEARHAGRLVGPLLAKIRPVAGDPDADRLTDALVAARSLLTACRPAARPRQRSCSPPAKPGTAPE